MDWKQDQVLDFWRFVAARQDMFVRRVLRREPPPWTKDPVLAGHYFTNVYRELDRGTRYLLKHILPYADKSDDAPRDVLFSVIVYRFFNHIPTYEILCAEVCEEPLLRRRSWDPDKAIAVLSRYQKEGERIFTGAYMINATGAEGPGSKVPLVIGRIEVARADLDSIYVDMLQPGSMEKAHARLTAVPGISGFNAYEMVIDLCYGNAVLPWHENDWVHPGPGAIWGLEHLLADHHKPIRKPLAQEAIEYLRKFQAHYLRMAGVVLQGPPLTLRNVEHSLCEFQKYRKGQTKGRTKRTYKYVNPDLSPWDSLPEEFARWR